MSDTQQIVIIGAGFSGAIIAARLLMQAEHPTEITLCDRLGKMAKGVAYSTEEYSHLLNVPAGKMSALAEAPDQFVRWLENNAPPELAATLNEESFAPRLLFGRYLEDVLHTAKSRARPGVALTPNSHEVIALIPQGSQFLVQFQNRKSIRADRVVLALGNFPGGATRSRFDSPVTTNAWNRANFRTIPNPDRILILGSGLTMVDTLISLKEQNHTGQIHVMSRHGFLPQRFDKPVPYPAFFSTADMFSVRHAFRIFRNELKKAAAKGIGWHSLMAALRPITAELWRAIPEKEKARFLRHLRIYWDTRRHQMPPELSKRIESWKADGTLQMTSGRILSHDLKSNGGKIQFRRRGETEIESLAVDRLIDCTGVDGNFATMTHPLIESLRRQDLIRPDRFGLGIDVDPSGRVIDGKGNVAPALFAMGALRRGDLWETTAVPELRIHAEQMAREVGQDGK